MACDGIIAVSFLQRNIVSFVPFQYNLMFSFCLVNEDITLFTPVTCLLKDRKTSAFLWTGVDERKYPQNISEILMVKFKWCCHLAIFKLYSGL